MKHSLFFAFFFLTLASHSQWYPINIGLDSLRTNALASDGENIYAGTKSGVYLSSDKGKNWISINNNLGVKHIYSLAIKENLIFAGTFKEGLFISSDKGASWKNCLKINQSTNINAILIKESNLFVGTSLNGAYISNDTGKTWKSLNLRTLPVNDVYAFLTYKNKIFAAPDFNSLFFSNDDGISWSEVHQIGIVRSLAANEKSIFAGCLDAPYHSTNDGLDWIRIGIQDIQFDRVFSLAAKKDIIFAGTEKQGIFLSTTNGRSWAQIGVLQLD